MSDQEHDMDIHVPDDVIVVVFSEVTHEYATEAAAKLRTTAKQPVVVINQRHVTGVVRVHRRGDSE